jgi:hypothetical protein
MSKTRKFLVDIGNTIYKVEARNHSQARLFAMRERLPDLLKRNAFSCVWYNHGSNRIHSCKVIL